MTATIADVRDNLAAICSSLDGWYGQARVGDQINPGAIVVTRQPFDPRMVLSGTKRTLMFQLHAYASRAGSEASEEALDALGELSGTGSLVAAVSNGDLWVDVSVDYAQVVEVGAVTLTTFGNDAAEYLACSFDVEVVW